MQGSERTGMFDAKQWEQRYGDDPEFQALTGSSTSSTRKLQTLTIGQYSCCSCPVPNSDELQAFANVTSHIGTFLSAIAVVYFISPGLIMLDCDRHNGTVIGYNGTQNYDCNPPSIIRNGSIGGAVGSVLFILMCAATAGHRVLSCNAPDATMLKRFTSHLAAFSVGIAAALFTSLWIIVKASCDFQNSTESGYNHSGIYDCNIHSVARQNSITGATFLGAGLFMYVMALVANRWDAGTVRNSVVVTGRTSYTDPNGSRYIDVGGTKTKTGEELLRDKYPVQYMEKYITAYTTKFCEVYEHQYRLASSSNYNKQLANSFALEYAKPDAERYGKKEALKHLESRESVSHESERISLASSTGTGSTVDKTEELKKQYPAMYMRMYIEAYILKFCEAYKSGQAKIVQDTAMEHAKTEAAEGIEGYLVLYEDRSMSDEQW